MELVALKDPSVPHTKFVVNSHYSEKEFIKKKGFEFQKPLDGDKGYWYTFDPHVAKRVEAHASPDIKAIIEKEIIRLENIYKFSYDTGEDFLPNFHIPVPDKINKKTGKKYEYLPCQRVAAFFGVRLKSLIIGDEPGIGKTIETAAIINVDESIKSVLVVTKKKIKSKWVQELKDWLVRPTSVGVEMMHCDIVVTNYDKLVRRTVMVEETKEDGSVVLGKNGKPNFVPLLDDEGNEMFYPNPFLDACVERQWDMLVLDECHRIKNPSARRTKGVFEVAGWNESDPLIHNPYRIRYRIALTGTPIPNRPLDMHNAIRLVIPWSKLAKLWYYGKRYCTGNTTNTTKHYGSSNLDELQTKLRQTCMIRRLKSQVLKQLPPKIHSIVKLDAEGKDKLLVDKQMQLQLQWQQEKSILTADMQKYKVADRAIFEAAASMLKECKGVYFSEMAKIRKELAISKVPYVIEHLVEMLEGGTEKILVGAHHHEVIDSIAEALQEWGVVTLDGRNQTDKYLKHVQDEFNNNPDCRIFIGGIQACGEGIDLYVSHNVVFAELDWVPGVIVQFADRTHRIGQLMQVLVEFVVFDGSLDSKFLDTMIFKQTIEDSALNSHAVPTHEKLVA